MITKITKTVTTEVTLTNEMVLDIIRRWLIDNGVSTPKNVEIQPIIEGGCYEDDPYDPLHQHGGKLLPVQVKGFRFYRVETIDAGVSAPGYQSQ